MRVLGVVPLYPPASRVGAWIATHELLVGLVQAGHTVDVVTYLGSAEYELDGVAVWPAKADIAELGRNADVVVAHLGDNGSGARAAKTHELPFVVMVHGTTSRPQTHGADLLVFNSEASKTWLASWTGPSIVAPPPLHPERFRTAPGDRVTLVNLAEDKGAGLFWLLTRSLPSIPFLGVRGGYGRQIIRDAPNLEVIREPTSNMRDDVFARTRVLVMPSKHEAWGMVGLEAMASGIPVIAHPTPGLRESLAGGGTFIDRHDFTGWRRTVELLATDQEAWTEASHRALARVAELDPEQSRRRFVAAVEALSASRRSRAATP